MLLAYQELIQESVHELKELESQTRSSRHLRRLQILRLLKSGQAGSMEKAVELVGLGVRQGYRLWSVYQKEGIKGLLKPARPRRKPKLDAAGQQALLEETAKGELATLSQVQQWLEKQQGVQYTQQGVWYVLKRLKIKLKTGRPEHYQQDKEAASEFKKTLPLE